MESKRMFTFLLIIINILIYILMVQAGVSFFEPTPQQISDWGGSSGVRTILQGEWWRLLTSMFVHIGIIHLLMNMYVLFKIGSLLEPIIGKLRFITVYLATGVFGGLLSQIWHSRADHVIVEAGASGAIFGITGVFLAFTTTNLFSQELKKELLKKLGIFIFANILYGIQSTNNVSMTAHIGGLVSGCVLGYCLYPSLVYHHYQKALNFSGLGAIVLLTLISSFGVATNLKKEDALHFHKMVAEYRDIETTLNSLLKKVPLDDKNAFSYMNQSILPLWEQALSLANQAKLMRLEQKNAQYRDYLVKWIALNYKKISLITELMKADSIITQQKIRNLDAQIAKLDEALNASNSVSNP